MCLCIRGEYLRSAFLLYCRPRQDGIALLVGVVNELLDRGLGCPKTLLTTHYTEAFSESMASPAVCPCPDRHLIPKYHCGYCRGIVTTVACHVKCLGLHCMRTGYLPVDNSLLKFQQMEIASSADTSSSTQSADIVFLYNLVEGRCNMSHGRLCVRSAWCLVFDIIECLTVVSGCVYGQGCHGWRRARRARPCGCYS